MRLIRLTAVLLVLAACGDDGASTTSGPGTTLVGTSVVTTLVGTSVVTTEPQTGTSVVVTTAPPGSLPPHEYADLQPLLEPLVAPMGFTVTRASLVELGTYEVSPQGTHLAIYLEPLEATTPDEVAAALTTLAAVLVPEVFDRWSGLISFDFCQEPFTTDDGETPPSDTLLDITRQAALTIDWDTVTLAELIAADGPGLRVYAADHVRASDTWADAEAAAG